MTLPPAALPGFRAPTAPTEHKAHPGTEQLLGCPNCQSTADLVLDVPAVVHHRVQLVAIAGITDPEPRLAEADALPVDEDTLDLATKIRCLRCRWSYTGPRPARRAAPPPPA